MVRWYKNCGHVAFLLAIVFAHQGVAQAALVGYVCVDNGCDSSLRGCVFIDDPATPNDDPCVGPDCSALKVVGMIVGACLWSMVANNCDRSRDRGSRGSRDANRCVHAVGN
jgi:hypothetical protein